ncbi:hypothetical protein KJ359_007575 [Pestalotiopsis sp. 9143b]|nr:hypothetical protein KJ359_007575 [Pestalotiopsis sp. 9143b]
MSTKHLFVQKLANLEGAKGVDVARGFYEDVTVSSVDARVIHLEKILSIASPPPMLEATWESLEFRAKRLWRFLPAHGLVVAVDEDAPMAVTPEALRKVLLRLEPSPLSREPERRKKAELPEKEVGDDGLKRVVVEADEFDFVCAAQQLYYLAGSNGWAIFDPVKDINHLYAAAIDLTLKLEIGPAPGRQFPNRPPGMRPVGMPSMFPRGPPPPPPGRKKSCCGCCSCFCHSGPVRIIPSKRKKIATGFFKFGWLRNLFSRKKRYDSDASSINSSSSEESTLAD